MALIKHGDGQIIAIIKDNDKKINSKKAKNALEQAKQDVKKIDKDGNKTLSNTES